MTLEQFKKKAKKIPDTPGVYFFLDKRRRVLYIGKATSLRDRLRSYFAPDLRVTRGPIITGMIEKSASIDWRQTDSVLEALLLEAALIRSHKPPANTDLKDDKSFNYVVITKEEYPRVLVVRGKTLQKSDFAPLGSSQRSQNRTFAAPRYIFGPFPHGMQLQVAMKIIRKIFPYRDTCTPNSGKRCFNAQIGLCPGVCSGEISRKDYAGTVRHIALLFQGKKKILIKSLEREMKAAAKEEDFEHAQEIRRQLFALQHIQDVSLIKDEYRSTTLEASRIEAYDVAHLRGSANVGVMTVVEGGVPNKNEYRKFKIKTASPGDDTGALKEILSRRLGHDEWPMPRLVVVDGAAAQMNAARKVLAEYGIEIPVVGVTKDERHRPRAIQGARTVIKDRERDILLANAEAHRFAIGYHRKKSRKSLTSLP